MNRLKSFVEWNAFGVCSSIGQKLNIAPSRIRQYFIYASVLTMGSPIVLYMILAFTKNIRHFIRSSKRNPWYYL
jgi:phage shock protein PspC (stress-responsive transcriptional regulator)